MKKFTVQLLLVLGGALAGLILAELGVRILAPQKLLTASSPQIFFVRYDSDLGWVNIPGSSGEFRPYTDVPAVPVTINRFGYRGEAVATKEGTGRNRLLLLGDSNTFGYGIREGERFSDLLGRALPATEVVNLGVFGYGTDQEAILLEREGLGYAPRTVVLALSAGDLSDNMSSVNTGSAKPFFRLNAGQLELYNTPVPRKSPLLPSAAAGSRLKQMLYHNVHLYRLLVYRNMALHRFATDTVAEMTVPEGLQVTGALIRGMQALCRENRVKFLVMLIPHGIWLDGVKAGYFPALQGMLARDGIAFLDTTPALSAAAARGGQVFFAKDPVHLSPEGNRVVAEILAGYLRNQPDAGVGRR